MTGRDRLVLFDSGQRAEVALDGAELRAWDCGGTPLLWVPDAAIWPDTAPLLFPVVGWTRGSSIRVDGVRYPLGLHGFARARRFTVVEQWPSSALLRLVSDEALRALYPFDWTLDVTYALNDGALSIGLAVTNTGARTMPYACGLHPGFRWPFDGGGEDDYEIFFEHRESAKVPVISPDGLFTHDTRRIEMDGRRLPLSARLLAREALCFLDARSRTVCFRRHAGAAIDITFDDFPHIALWSRSPGRFLCIEAWTGRGDDVDADGDIFKKPSMRHLEGGATARHEMSLRYRARVWP